MDQLASMRVFLKIAESGSLSAAARRLDMSPSMVAKHLRALETRLDVRLLQRTTRRQALTEAGQIFRQHCRAILTEIAAAEQDVKFSRREPRGRLVISAPVTLGVHALAPAMAAFRATYKRVEVDLRLSDDPAGLMEDGVEAAIRIGDIRDANLVARGLAPYEMALAAAPAYLAQHGEPREPEDLLRYHRLAFALWPEAAPWRLTGPRGPDAKTFEIAVKPCLRINNGEALRLAAISGAGVVLQPRILLAADFRTGQLKEILGNYDLPSRPVHLLYRPDVRITPKLRVFIDFVVARFAAGDAGARFGG